MKNKSLILGLIGLLLIASGAITYKLFNDPESIDYDGNNYYKTFYNKQNKNLINDSIKLINEAKKIDEVPNNDYEAIIIPVNDKDYIEGYTFIVKYIKNRRVGYAFNGIDKNNYFILLTDIEDIQTGNLNTEKSNYVEAIKKYMYKELTNKEYDIDKPLLDIYKDDDSIIKINKEEYRVVQIIEQ